MSLELNLTWRTRDDDSCSHGRMWATPLVHTAQPISRTLTINGCAVHVTAIRVHRCEDGWRAECPDLQENVDAVQTICGTDCLPQTFEIKDVAGDWLLAISPHAV